jgi:phosphoglycolate phosphatase-like HAD superfamily hydrolase
MFSPFESLAPGSSPKLPDLVIFDLIGVLTPDRPRVVACLAAALSDADISVTSTELEEMACLPIRMSIARWVTRQTRVAPEVAQPLVRAIVMDFNDRLVDSLRPGGRPIVVAPGASTLLAELAAEGVHIGIDSELDGDIATAWIRAAGWSGCGWMDAVVGADEVLTPRPGPGQIEEIRRRCGLQDGARVVKVVGTHADAQAANKAGCEWVVSLIPGVVPDSCRVSDLGELAERLLERVLV